MLYGMGLDHAIRMGLLTSLVMPGRFADWEPERQLGVSHRRYGHYLLYITNNP